MRFIDPHIHMASRTTDDYERMKAAGIVAVIEPAFWMGQPRTNVGSFVDYLSSIVGWERFRASQFGIRHYCTIGLNSKEANNEALAEAVMDVLPRYLSKEGVVAVGEIGYDDQTALEDKYYRAQLQLARDFEMLGDGAHAASRQEVAARSAAWTSLSRWAWRRAASSSTTTTRRPFATSSIAASGRRSPSTRTPRWATSGWSRSCASTAPSASSSTRAPTGAFPTRWRCPRRRSLMLERGIAAKDVEAIVLRQCARRLRAERPDARSRTGSTPDSVDQRTLFEGNSVLRGQTPRVGTVPESQQAVGALAFK